MAQCYSALMRRYFVWYGLAVLWVVIAVIGWIRHHSAQAALPALFACCFFAVGLYIRRRDKSHLRR